MSKKLKISYILFFIFSAVLIAWNTCAAFFGGVAINFVALIGLVFTILLFVFADKSLFSRIKDLFFVACGFCVLELVVYFAFEFGWVDFNMLDNVILVQNSITSTALKGFIVYQNILSILGMLFFAYTAFRFVAEMKDKKIRFVEILLGNQKRSVKVKKTKEISNGCLEEKPNKQNNDTKPNEEDVVIVETEE